MNERIRMDGEPVSDETFTRLFLRTQQSVRRMEAEGLPHPSFFEFLFGMAMAGFEEAGVEYVILETGLGGRLDATNSISGRLPVSSHRSDWIIPRFWEIRWKRLRQKRQES